MSATREHHVLAENFLFKELSPELLKRISELGRTVSVTSGEILFRKGDPGDKLYSVLSGRVEITVDKPDGTRDVLNTIGAGSSFGEIAILDGYPRTADAVVAEDAELHVISRDAFLGFLRDDTAVFEHVLGLLCRRVRWVSDLIEQRNRAEAERRKLNSAVEHSPNVVLITDPRGRIEYVNPKFSELTGWESGEVLGERPSILKSGKTSDETYRELWQAITAGREWRGELFNRRKDGEFYWENCCIAPITDEEGGITHFVAVKEDMTERKRLEEELRRLATTDSLTGVANRRHFISITADEVTRCTRQAHPLSFLMVDVDHFKSVNDTYGHGIGDDALKRLAQTLTESMRPHDTVGRLGGEEFAIVLPEADAEEALAVAERLRQAVSEIVLDTDKGPLQFTCSIGAATYGAQDDGIESLMNRADDALYAAKTGGRNRVVRAER